MRFPDKLAEFQSQVRIGGKGTPRRKHKHVRKSPTTIKKRLKVTHKKSNVPLPEVEKVNMLVGDGNIVHFAAPAEETPSPGLGNADPIEIHSDHDNPSELGPDSLGSLPELAEFYPADASEDDDYDDIPELVDDFDFDVRFRWS
ncbi:nascent polypeptide-associated complex subunit beta [Jimgerdemannia flammicorona]|uniref:Nascent polypeptide-associated complex subunit beta n=1 Tax=Jimgerdemannia flammicorona TaxID=994334 RepID=A0A433QQ95_9FUNG|nr:nascent polypeptide-associated complex subunit beta [Jimgerdemannia flammicorona]